NLSRGVQIQKFGPKLKDFVRLKLPEPRKTEDRIEGEVIYLDRFGNAITNIRAELLPGIRRGFCAVYDKRQSIFPVKNFYDAVPPKMPVAVLGSSGFLEIAVNRGSAERLLRLKIGSRVSLRRGT